MNIILMPLTGFIIGMLTNWLVLVMLFHPRKKIFGIQGIIPKRKALLAKKIGEISPEIMPPFLQRVKNIPFIGSKIVNAFAHSVELRAASLSDEELEKMTHSLLKREFRFIVWMGGFLGFLIGCLQYLIFIYL